MRLRGKVVLWPLYFDGEHTWHDGRRVSGNLALKNVRADEIFQAALDMGLNPELQADAAHPRHPWERRGAVIIDKTDSKTKIIGELAKRMRQKRTVK